MFLPIIRRRCEDSGRMGGALESCLYRQIPGLVLTLYPLPALTPAIAVQEYYCLLILPSALTQRSSSLLIYALPSSVSEDRARKLSFGCHPFFKGIGRIDHACIEPTRRYLLLLV
jgi:hypothetical protein